MRYNLVNPRPWLTIPRPCPRHDLKSEQSEDQCLAQIVRGLSETMVRRGGSGDNEEGRAFEQDGLSRAAGLSERCQVLGQDRCVGDALLTR